MQDASFQLPVFSYRFLFPVGGGFIRPVFFSNFKSGLDESSPYTKSLIILYFH
jgi:hypothetical protein